MEFHNSSGLYWGKERVQTTNLQHLGMAASDSRVVIKYNQLIDFLHLPSSKDPDRRLNPFDVGL